MGHVLVVEGREEAVIGFDGLGSQAPQGLIFGVAFAGGFKIVQDIACPAVQESMMAAGGAAEQAAFFYQRNAKAARRQVMGQGTAGASAPDDQNPFQFIRPLPWPV